MALSLKVHTTKWSTGSWEPPTPKFSFNATASKDDMTEPYGSDYTQYMARVDCIVAEGREIPMLNINCPNMKNLKFNIHETLQGIKSNVEDLKERLSTHQGIDHRDDQIATEITSKLIAQHQKLQGMIYCLHQVEIQGSSTFSADPTAFQYMRRLSLVKEMINAFYFADDVAQNGEKFCHFLIQAADLSTLGHSSFVLKQFLSNLNKTMIHTGQRDARHYARSARSQSIPTDESGRRSESSFRRVESPPRSRRRRGTPVKGTVPVRSKSRSRSRSRSAPRSNRSDSRRDSRGHSRVSNGDSRSVQSQDENRNGLRTGGASIPDNPQFNSPPPTTSGGFGGNRFVSNNGDSNGSRPQTFSNGPQPTRTSGSRMYPNTTIPIVPYHPNDAIRGNTINGQNTLNNHQLNSGNNYYPNQNCPPISNQPAVNQINAEDIKNLIEQQIALNMSKFLLRGSSVSDPKLPHEFNDQNNTDRIHKDGPLAHVRSTMLTKFSGEDDSEYFDHWFHKFHIAINRYAPSVVED